MEASMLSPDRISTTPMSAAHSDYEMVRRAIAFISEQWRQQPEIDAIAEAAGVSATELHHLFRRWAGLTPKAFLQALTLDSARKLLRDSASVLDASYELGLAGLAFADPGENKSALADMQRRWPKASYLEDTARTAPLARRIFDQEFWRPD